MIIWVVEYFLHHILFYVRRFLYHIVKVMSMYHTNTAIANSFDGIACRIFKKKWNVSDQDTVGYVAEGDLHALVKIFTGLNFAFTNYDNPIESVKLVHDGVHWLVKLQTHLAQEIINLFWFSRKSLHIINLIVKLKFNDLEFQTWLDGSEESDHLYLFLM